MIDCPKESRNWFGIASAAVGIGIGAWFLYELARAILCPRKEKSAVWRVCGGLCGRAPPLDDEILRAKEEAATRAASSVESGRRFDAYSGDYEVS